MKRGARFCYALLIVTGLWLLFSWPLPKHVMTGIPSQSRSVEKGQIRDMTPGDHLQLLYHFWLASDMLRGETPFLHNPYEFNTGDDSERRVPDPYYIPFSLVYAAAERIGGRAFGWNMAGFVSIFLSFWASCLLARRYSRSDWVALAAATVAVTLPYRWTTLLVGSPTGFATALVPVLLLGIDMAVRDDRPAGGLLAGMAILFAYCSDLHVFFFSVLATPAWCIVAFVTRRDFQWRRGAAWGKLVMALLPTVLFGVAALAISLWLKQSFTGTSFQEGHPLEIIARYSPARSGLVSYANTGVSNRVFVGYLLPVLLMLGFIAEAITLVTRRGTGSVALRRGLFLLLIIGALVIVTSLALGMNGPRGGAILIWCRKLIPPYAMIRQPAKAFCLMPALLSIALAFALSALLDKRLGRFRYGIVSLLFLGMVAEHKLQIEPAICGLRTTQGAYAEVTRHAAIRNQTPRALVLPLWPGDSHWSSLYEYYASLYRLRMVNGYSPVVRDDYVENVIKRFESINQGLITPDQVSALQDMGVQYILLHEDAFPEKVSPYPVAFTLHGLQTLPYLQTIAQDESVWAFHIAPKLVKDTDSEPQTWFPAWRWEAEHTACTGGVVKTEAQVSEGAYRQMAAPGDAFSCHTRAPMVIADGLRWMMRVRGAGQLHSTLSIDDVPAADATHVVKADSWEWLSISVPQSQAFARTGIDISLAGGTCDVDTLFLTAGEWSPMAVGDTRRIPAASFFHAGYTEPETGSVVLRASADPHGAVFYGPLLPLDPGRYKVALATEAAGAWSSPDLIFGFLAVAESGEVGVLFDITTDGRHEAEIMRPSNLPLRLELHFARAADLRVQSVTITRLP